MDTLITVSYNEDNDFDQFSAQCMKLENQIYKYCKRLRQSKIAKANRHLEKAGAEMAKLVDMGLAIGFTDRFIQDTLTDISANAIDREYGQHKARK